MEKFSIEDVVDVIFQDKIDAAAKEICVEKGISYGQAKEEIVQRVVRMDRSLGWGIVFDMDEQRAIAQQKKKTRLERFLSFFSSRRSSRS